MLLIYFREFGKQKSVKKNIAPQSTYNYCYTGIYLLSFVYCMYVCVYMCLSVLIS